jgi:hypothetical protein
VLEDVVEETFGTICRQIGEHHDDCVVIHALAMNGLLQERRLVSVDELDHIGHIAAGDVFGREPQRLPLQGFRHEGAHGPLAAEIRVRLGHETRDPVCNGAKRREIASRERPRLACVVEILEQIEMGSLCGHGSLLRCDA